MSKEPEFARPEVGDELVIVHPGGRYQEEKITPVRVVSVGRFKITVEGLSGSALPMRSTEFDIRDRKSWATAAERKYSRQDVEQLFTAELLAWRDRRSAANRYLRESGLPWVTSLKGTLRAAVEADPIGFVNTLRRFEGLEEI